MPKLKSTMAGFAKMKHSWSAGILDWLQTSMLQAASIMPPKVPANDQWDGKSAGRASDSGDCSAFLVTLSAGSNVFWNHSNSFGGSGGGSSGDLYGWYVPSKRSHSVV